MSFKAYSMGDEKVSPSTDVAGPAQHATKEACKMSNHTPVLAPFCKGWGVVAFTFILIYRLL